MLTEEQKKLYLDKKGLICPVCKSNRVDSYDHEFDDNYVYGYCSCTKCKAEWTDTYILVDVELDEK